MESALVPGLYPIDEIRIVLICRDFPVNEMFVRISSNIPQTRMVEPNDEITTSDEIVNEIRVRRRGESIPRIFTFSMKFELGDFLPFE